MEVSPNIPLKIETEDKDLFPNNFASLNTFYTQDHNGGPHVSTIYNMENQSSVLKAQVAEIFQGSNLNVENIQNSRHENKNEQRLSGMKNAHNTFTNSGADLIYKIGEHPLALKTEVNDDLIQNIYRSSTSSKSFEENIDVSKVRVVKSEILVNEEGNTTGESFAVLPTEADDWQEEFLDVGNFVETRISGTSTEEMVPEGEKNQQRSEMSENINFDEVILNSLFNFKNTAFLENLQKAAKYGQNSIDINSEIQVSVNENGEKKFNPEVTAGLFNNINTTVFPTFNFENSVFDSTPCSSVQKEGIPEVEYNLKSIFSRDQQRFECNMCGYSTLRKGFFDKHLRIHLNRFQCNQCNFVTNKKSRLNTHALSHSEEKAFACDKCHYKTNIKHLFQRHYLIHSDTALFKCEECSYQTNRKDKLKRHKTIHNTEDNFVCNICPYRTNNNSKLKVHRLNHCSTKLYKCEKCSYETNRSDHLSRHSLSHSEVKRFKCPNCPYQTNRKDHLQNHSLIHLEGANALKCIHCSYRTLDENSLKAHLNKVHSTIEIFKCSECPYETKRKYHYQRHSLIHAKGEKPFKCTVCSFQSNRKDHLQNHILVHSTGEDVFRCPHCSYKTNNKASMDSHLSKSHSTIEIFSCSECAYETRRKHHYQRHLLIHSKSDKLFKCEICTFETNRRDHLQSHFLTHIETRDLSFMSPLAKELLKIKLYKCDMCSYETKRKYHYQRHLLVHSKPEAEKQRIDPAQCLNVINPGIGKYF